MQPPPGQPLHSVRMKPPLPCACTTLFSLRTFSALLTTLAWCIKQWTNRGWCLHFPRSAQTFLKRHFLSVSFFSISATHCRNHADSNINRPESTSHERIISSHQALNLPNYPFVYWRSNYLTIIPFVAITLGYIVSFGLFASILHLSLVGDFCGRQLNTSQSTSSNILDTVNMFNLLSSWNTRSNYAPIINTGAPPSTPCILTKDIKSIPEHMAKNDFVYCRQDKDNNKTTNGERLSLATKAGTRLYELAKWEMGMDEEDLR